MRQPQYLDKLLKLHNIPSYQNIPIQFTFGLYMKSAYNVHLK